MAWANPKTWAIGDVLTAADMNQYVRDNTKSRPRVSLTNTGGGTIAIPSSATFTTVTWDTAQINTDSMYSGGATSKITFQHDGDYLFGGRILWGAHADGSFRGMQIVKNGSDILLYVQAQPDAASSLQAISNSGTDLGSFVAGDYIELKVAQQSGATINLFTNDDQYSSFYAVWEGV